MPSMKRPAQPQQSSQYKKTRQRQADPPGQTGPTAAAILQQALDPAAAARLKPADVLVLQRAIGNRAVTDLLARPPAASGPPGVVQAKLKGSYDALAATASISPGNIASAKEYGRFHTSRWFKLVTTLSDYEDIEQHVSEALPALQGRPDMLAQALQPLASRLELMIKNAQEWQQSSTHLKEIAAGNELALKRAQAIRVLLPRLQLELSDIKTGRYLETSVSGKLTTAPGGEAAIGGALNVLDKVVDKANEPGFFREEKPTEESPLAPLMGINKQTPNLGARAVAMYRLDRLLEAGVIIKTEFATHGQHQRITGMVKNRKGEDEQKVIGLGAGPTTQKQGIFMAAARGQMAGGEGGALESMSQGAMAGATFQRGLVKLQMLDALTGQIDRHLGNYFIQKNARGEVIGVQGIDNDLSFGTILTDESGGNVADPSRGKGKGLAQFRGLPPVVDEPLAERFLALKEADLRQVLAPLLGPAEVEATLARLQVIKRELAKMKAEGLFIKPFQWGRRTLKELGAASESYVGLAKGANYNSALMQLIPDAVPGSGAIRSAIMTTLDSQVLDWPLAQTLARQAAEVVPGGINAPSLVEHWAVDHGRVGRQVKGFLTQAGFTGNVDEAAYAILHRFMSSGNIVAVNLEQCKQIAQRLPKTLVDPRALINAVLAAQTQVQLETNPYFRELEAILMANGFARVIGLYGGRANNEPLFKVKTLINEQIEVYKLIDQKQGLEVARQAPALLLQTMWADWPNAIRRLARNERKKTPFYRSLEAVLMANGFGQVIAANTDPYFDPLFQAVWWIDQQKAGLSEEQIRQVAANATRFLLGQSPNDWRRQIGEVIRQIKALNAAPPPGAPAPHAG